MWSSNSAKKTNQKNIRGHSCYSMTTLNGRGFTMQPVHTQMVFGEKPLIPLS